MIGLFFTPSLRVSALASGLHEAIPKSKKNQQNKKVAELETSKTEMENLKVEIANIKRVLGIEAKAKKE